MRAIHCAERGFDVQVRLLGPVDVALNGESRPVNGLRRKAVLATLALHDGQVVSIDRLVDVVWGESAPPTAANTLQSHISYLRGVLGSRAAILARPPGYLLNLGGDGTDAGAAERLLRQGRQTADPAQGARQLREALALWRGRPLADVTGSDWLEEQSQRLELLADDVRRALFEARLAAGEHAELVPGLERMAAGDPLDEQVHGQLMLALYRCGRQADALTVFRRLRAVLAEQLGVDPSPMLRDLQTAILRQDQALAARARPLSSLAARPVPVPAQLPPAVPGFAGRGAELARLDAVLAQAERERSAGSVAVVISAVSGTAGVGKTSLAVHWAHRVAPRFPDGQLYVNLRGFDPSGRPVEPAEAVRGFLDALGAPEAGIPDGAQAQAALYRSLVAGKRVLVVLDNARDASQVRPLLPGSPGCLVLVTSRSDLAGLVAAEGAYPVGLDLLTTAEASDLLARRLGEARVAGEPEATGEIIDRCARLPLALSIAAARAAARPGFPLTAIAAELRDADATLDPFGGTDLATDVRAVFSWSCQALTGGAARLFRLLGLHPGPGIGAEAAASLAATGVSGARALLAELTGAHLLTEPSPGRYTCHDLLRAYAREQVQAQDSPQARGAAVRRVLEYFLHASHAATALVEPNMAMVPLESPGPGVAAVTGLATAGDGVAWFTAEHAALAAAVQLAADAGLAAHAWQLVLGLTSDLLRRGRWDEHAAACHAALAAVRRAGDTAGEAHVLMALGMGYSRSGRFREAEPLFHQALQLLETAGGYLCSQAMAHHGLTWLAEHRQRPADMLRHTQAAYALWRAAGNQLMHVATLNDIGYCHALAGDYQQAISYCERALPAVQELGDVSMESNTWHSLGHIYHQLGSHQRAIACYERSAAMSRDLADLFNEADTLSRLGEVHHSAGDLRAARRAWTQALRIFEETGHPEAWRIRARLRAAAGSPGPPAPSGSSPSALASSASAPPAPDPR